MAESNARREARRRQILENAESRLRKITGRSNLDETKDNNLQVKSNSLKTACLTEYDVRNGTYDVNSKATQQDYTRFQENEISNDTPDSTNISLTEQLSKRKSLLHILLFSRVSLIVLAAIVNVLLILELDNLCLGQAVIPYFVLMLARLSVCNKLQDMQEGSLLYAALLLCNIQHNVVNRVKTFFAFFTLVFRDFGLYMFNFVLMHYVAMCYLGYDITVPKNT